MFIYAGIDEAGYGPMFGPLLVGRAVLAVDQASPTDPPPQMWKKLSSVVCKDLSRRRGRIAVNDSKKLYTPDHGLKHLERGVLAFTAAAGLGALSLDQLLESLGESSHRDLAAMPWYAPSAERPWAPLPCACTIGEIAVARAMLTAAMKRLGVSVLDMGAAVVFEDRFNQMAAATRNKAALSFTFVAGHLRRLWERFADRHPTVVVDRQSGRTFYRELLAMNFPEAHLTVLEENEKRSAYCAQVFAEGGAVSRSMTVSFEVDADARHMPVALASMISKYTRELLMARLQTWFTQRAPHVAPTAGYALDAQRFWAEIRPILPQLQIRPEQLVRIC